MRKRASEMPYVDWSLDLIGGQLLIYMDGEGIWQNNTVVDCTVMWVENGTKAYVKHTLQKIDSRYKPYDDEYDVDLKKVKRYVVAPFAPILESEEYYKLKKGKEKLHKRLADLDQQIERYVLCSNANIPPPSSHHPLPSLYI